MKLSLFLYFLSVKLAWKNIIKWTKHIAVFLHISYTKKIELVHAMFLKAGYVRGHYLRDDYKIILNLQVSQNKSLKQI